MTFKTRQTQVWSSTGNYRCHETMASMLSRKSLCCSACCRTETLVYVFHSVEDAPLSRVVYEVYANQEAVAQHQSAEYFQRAMVELDQSVLSARTEVLGAPNGKLMADVSGKT